MVLDWLKTLGQKPDHPMYSLEEAKKLLADLPSDPLKALDEITSWLSTLATATGIRPANRIAVARLLDETGQLLEQEIVAPMTSEALRHFRRVQLWKAALEFRQASANAYAGCIKELRRDSNAAALQQQKELPVLIVCALRALAEQDKILHLRYEAVSADSSQPAYLVCILSRRSEGAEALLRRVPIRATIWQPMFDLFRLSETAGCGLQRVKAYPYEPPTSARQEFVRALMLQAAAPEGMLPRQVEFAARVAARFAPSFLFSSRPDAGCNWYCDLVQGGSDASAPPCAPAPTRRFFGAGAVISKLEQLISQLSTEPDKMEDPLDADYSAQDQISVLDQLLAHWQEPPPLRRKARPPGTAEYALAHGFAAACELVPRISGVTEAARPASASLAGLEVATDAADIAIERWHERDRATWGVGVAVPRKSEAWVGIGALCTLRVDDGAWFITVVRRLYRDSSKQQFAGLEILSKAQSFASLRGIGGAAISLGNWDAAGDDSTGLVKAILLQETANAGERHELLVTRGNFAAGAIYEVLSDRAMPQLRMEESLGQGEDFERVRFTWLDERSAAR